MIQSQHARFQVGLLTLQSLHIVAFGFQLNPILFTYNNLLFMLGFQVSLVTLWSLHIYGGFCMLQLNPILSPYCCFLIAGYVGISRKFSNSMSSWYSGFCTCQLDPIWSPKLQRCFLLRLTPFSHQENLQLIFCSQKIIFYEVQQKPGHH